MSTNAFGSDWSRLESYTYRFRDPLNRERRFIPLRLDDATPPGSLSQFRYADWREDPGTVIDQLVDACRPDTVEPPPPAAAPPTAEQRTISLGHTDSVWTVAYSPDGTHAITAARDNTARIWDVTTGSCVRVLEGHTAEVWAVAYNPDGNHAITGSNDNTARIWNLTTGTTTTILEGHTTAVVAVAWRPDRETLATVAANGVLRFWAPAEGQPAEEAVMYTNAKVVLVGESQAGKSGLAIRLATGQWEHTESTVGAWATQMLLPHDTNAEARSDGRSGCGTSAGRRINS